VVGNMATEVVIIRGSRKCLFSPPAVREIPEMDSHWLEWVMCHPRASNSLVQSGPK
jgi:hypothetical protein